MMKNAVVILMVLFVGLVGCKGKKDAQALAAQKESTAAVPNQPQLSQEELAAQDAFFKVDEKIMAGDHKGAVVLLDEMLEDDSCLPDRQWLFARLLGSLMEAEGVDAAKERYIAVLGTDDDLTRGGFGIVCAYYRGKNDNEGLEEWLQVLSEKGLPEDLAARAMQWRMESAYAGGDMDAVLALIPECNSEFGDAVTRQVVSGLIRSSMAEGKFEVTAKLLGALEKCAGGSALLLDYVKSSRIELAFRRQEWEKGRKLFESLATELPDNELVSCFSQVLPILISEKQQKIAEDLCVFVLETQKGKEGVRRRAAIQLMNITRRFKDASEIAPCFRKLEGYGIPPELELMLIDSQFYHVIQNGSKDDYVAMIQVCRDMIPRLSDPKCVSQARIMVFDGSFVIEDYATAEQILNEGIPEKDPEWIEMALNKLKAHVALKNGDKKEALKRFRAFMDYVDKNWESPIQNPLTGLLYTREMCLAFNARRIGDILASTDDKKGAEAAYRESMEYYEKALADSKADSKEYEYVQTEMAKVPASDTKAQ